MGMAEWNEVVFTDESRICLQHHDDRIRVCRHRGKRMLNSCVMHRHTGPVPGIMVWGGIRYHSRTLVRIAGTLTLWVVSFLLKSYSESVYSYFAIRFKNATDFFPFPLLKLGRSNGDNFMTPFGPFVKAWTQPYFNRIMWPMVAQRLTQITPPAATPDQLWQRMEAAWSAVPQEHIQSLFESMPRCVAVVISNNDGYSGY
ncbi:transposable element Tcb1 transposase [Trichonephila clavipes]|nr:transposable element Tcb1 transposase [Trichonephila clavipes]